MRAKNPLPAPVHDAAELTASDQRSLAMYFAAAVALALTLLSIFYHAPFARFRSSDQRRRP